MAAWNIKLQYSLLKIESLLSTLRFTVVHNQPKDYIPLIENLEQGKKTCLTGLKLLMSYSN
jgi:hypothetical protein